MYNSDSYKIGQIASIRKVILEEDVIVFSNVCRDLNPLHIDSGYAEKSIFKKRIVNGMLCGSLISAVIGTKLPGHGAIYLSQTLKFIKPVYIGDEVEAFCEIIDLYPEKSIMKLHTYCVNNGIVVIDGEALVKF